VKPEFIGDRAVLFNGDCGEVLKTLPPDSVDAIVTDPPAGIGFMGKSWDGDKGGRDAWIAWLADIMREGLRILKPGGHALVWAIPRTSHWTATALELAGFEIRDVVVHLFGTGFPKSLDVSKAIDKAAGAEREVIAPGRYANRGRRTDNNTYAQSTPSSQEVLTAAATPEAAQWAGWGTALKPAAEHWILARKPLVGTVAANVLEYGTGVLNIDGCRIGTSKRVTSSGAKIQNGASITRANPNAVGTGFDPNIGRWPANVTLDEESAAMLDVQSGTGASRFFYCAKPSRTERHAGTADGNKHPTVKAIALMRWLCRLITPPGGVVLDPFAGSGSTGAAALAEGFEFVGVEREQEYFEIALARLRHAVKP
jgi:site-specific DNA-methyltransferase (adenine-specific)